MRSLIGTLINKAPVSYVSRASTGAMGRSIFQKNDAQTQMQAYGSIGTLFAIVNRLSNTTSKVTWRLYRSRDGRGRIAGEEDRREVTSHLALDVWNKPNEFYNSHLFVETFQQHIELTGEAWWLISRTPGFEAPLELWPVRPDRMTPVPSKTNFLAGYVYTGPDGEKVPLDLNEVVFLKMPNPLDPYRGMGPVQSIMVDIDSAKYGAEWNRNFFINSAEPGGIVEFEDGLDDEEFKQFQMRWREQHQGVAQAHRVALIENGGKWRDRQMSMKDMQFAELRNVSREIMLEAFGLAKTMVGSTEHVNRASALAAEYVFSRYTLKERLDRIKDALNFFYLPLFGESGKGVEFDYDDPSPVDKEGDRAERDSKINALDKLIRMGFDEAEALKWLGLPEMKLVRPPTEASEPSEETKAPTGPPESVPPSSNGSNRVSVNGGRG